MNNMGILLIAFMLISIVFLSGCIENEPKHLDSDGDGYIDDFDDFPNNSSEWLDTDFDGVGDNSDAFPEDPNEWYDTDGDLIGNNADIYDFGNGGLKVNITRFEGKDSLDSDGGIMDPQFWIIIKSLDIISGEWVKINSSNSTTYYDKIELINPLTALFDIDDDLEVVVIEIYAFDEVEDDDTEGGPLFDYIDINGRLSAKEYWSIVISITNLYPQPRTFSEDGSLDLEIELDGIVEGVYEIIKI
jgi:hypothetical protein